MLKAMALGFATGASIAMIIICIIELKNSIHFTGNANTFKVIFFGFTIVTLISFIIILVNKLNNIIN